MTEYEIELEQLKREKKALETVVYWLIGMILCLVIVIWILRF